MSKALASFIPLFADKLGSTQSALYERQRALVRAGVMETEGRKGPGSGVQTTADSVALLLISAMAGEGLTPAIDLTLIVMNATSTDDKCSLTGHSRFLDALASALAMQSRSSKLVELRLNRTKRTAEIEYKDKSARKVSVFGGGPAAAGGVQVTASVSSDSFRAIAEQVRQAIELKAELEFRGEE